MTDVSSSCCICAGDPLSFFVVDDIKVSIPVVNVFFAMIIIVLLDVILMLILIFDINI